jgi:hypothetical protein
MAAPQLGDCRIKLPRSGLVQPTAHLRRTPSFGTIPEPPCPPSGVAASSTDPGCGYISQGKNQSNPHFDFSDFVGSEPPHLLRQEGFVNGDQLRNVDHGPPGKTGIFGG